MSDFTLEKNPVFSGVEGPLLLVIMDGVGLYRGQAEGYEGNAVDQARTPNLDRLLDKAPVFMKLKAHGLAVGLPSDGDMGNSEVGHNAMGAGRIFDQGAKLVNRAIESKVLFEGKSWKELVSNVKQKDSCFHLIGLLSDGNVHSHVHHINALLQRLAEENVSQVRLHPLADGRDVDPVSYHIYLEALEKLLTELRQKGTDARIASGGGRMKITMDRYEANWQMVKKGWQCHVQGRGRLFTSAIEAVESLRNRIPGIIDQDLPRFVVADAKGQPCGPIVDGDSVVFFNFRGDRAIEISRAFTEKDFKEFDREVFPDVMYAGMMQYDGDLHIPPRFLVSPPAITRTLSEYLARNGIPQLATAETQKFGHVTYFWNGNNSEKFDEETEQWVEVQSDSVPFETTPAMKACEVNQVVLNALSEGKHKFLRVNFANGDMVGHTGVMDASIKAVEVVDECIGKLEKAVKKAGGTMIVTADHGNSDMMLEVNKKTGELKQDEAGKPVIKTSHTLSPVPLILLGKDADRFQANADIGDPGLGNLAPTLLMLLGYEPPEGYLPSLISLKEKP